MDVLARAFAVARVNEEFVYLALVEQADPALPLRFGFFGLDCFSDQTEWRGFLL